MALRIFDTLISDEIGFFNILPYVCVTMILNYSEDLKKK